jgi:glycosyltransferase involved in cell wall biosynthesis
MLDGQYTGRAAEAPSRARPVVVFAGRHIPEKRVPALVPAIVRARAQLPQLRGEIYGDGPERGEVIHLIEELGAADFVSAPGFVASDVLAEALEAALCFVLPSEREGYGLVVVESTARGVPVVVVAGPDNAATEHIEEGVNGVIASSVEELGEAIVRVERAGFDLRASTLEWFRRNEERLSLRRSLELVTREYEAHARTPAASAAQSPSS